MEIIAERVVLTLGYEVDGTPAHNAPVIPVCLVLLEELLGSTESDDTGRDGYIRECRVPKDLLRGLECGGKVRHSLTRPLAVRLEAPHIERSRVVQLLRQTRLAKEVCLVLGVLEQNGERR